MLEERCARIPSNRQDHSTWLSALLPAADERDYVDLSMDLMEGRVRYRKGKKVRLAFQLQLNAIYS